MKRDAEERLEQTSRDIKRLKPGELGDSQEINTSLSGLPGSARDVVDEDGDVAERVLKQSSLQRDVVYSQKKLFLVLDLDHTLLNSILFAKVHRDEALRISSLLHSNSDSSTCNNHIDLHAFPDFRIFTKLRPFVQHFLCQASTMFELFVYTMGSRSYAEAMVRLLDPSQRLFGSRIISRADNNGSKFKSLDLVSAPASATIILDDSHRVWPDSQLANLIQMDRYHFFDSSSKEFAVHTPSLLGSLQDESGTSGTLACTLDLLYRVHHAFFDEADSQGSTMAMKDVRPILQRNVLYFVT